MENKEKQINNLQEVINTRAKNKLEKDIEFLENLYSLDNYKYKNLCEGIRINRGTDKEPDIITNVIHIFRRTSRVGQEIFNNNIEKYIEKETRLFIKEIEELKQRNDEIENSLENLRYEVNR